MKKVSTKIIAGLAGIACIAGFSGYNRYVEQKQQITSDKTLSAVNQNPLSKKNLSLVLDEQPDEKNTISSIIQTQEVLAPEKEITNLTSQSNVIPTPETVVPSENQNTKNNLSNTTTDLLPAAEITQTVVSKETTPVVVPDKKKNTKTRAS